MNLGTEGVHQHSLIECGFGESVAVLSELSAFIVQCYDYPPRRHLYFDVVVGLVRS